MDTYLKEFQKFLKNELMPATSELKTLENEDSRKHIQKLIYTNLVDRFDYCIDNTLVNFLENDESFRETLLKKHENPINESDVITLILAEDPKKEVILKLKNTLRNTELRNRHSLKLLKLLTTLKFDKNDLHRPRVNPSSGCVSEKYKIQSQNKKIPASILGYSDWLYSRRSAIVHGGGSNKLSKNDLDQLKKLYSVDAAKSVRISLSSINSANTFYSNLLDEIFNHL